MNDYYLTITLVKSDFVFCKKFPAKNMKSAEQKAKKLLKSIITYDLEESKWSRPRKVKNSTKRG